MLTTARSFSTNGGWPRLRREVQAAWRVTHPGVVRIYDLIALGDHLALSMELVDGDTLDRRVARDGRLPEAELLALALELARALAAAHEVGVTIATSSRRTSCSAPAAAAPSSPTSAVAPARQRRRRRRLRRRRRHRRAFADALGDLLGTPAYMAPEQLRRSPDVGPAADVYSLGLRAVRGGHRTTRLSQKTLAELMKARLEERPPSGGVAAARAAAELCASSTTAGDRSGAPQSTTPKRCSRDWSRDASRRWRRAALAVAPGGDGAAAPGGRARCCRARWLGGRLPAHDRRVAFVVDGSGDLDRALAQLAQHRFAAADHHVTTVADAALANVVVDLRWQLAGESVTVAATLAPSGGRARALGSERAASLSAALAPLLARVASVVDQRQPERIDAAEQEAMAHLGAPQHRRLSRVSRGV